jgi:hypothetical protein
LAADGYNCTWTVKINSPDINYEDWYDDRSYMTVV